MSNPYQSPKIQPREERAGYSAIVWHAQTKLNPAAAAQTVQDFFLAEGYRLEAGELHDAVYAIGNKMTRLMFGGFAKRYKFKVRVVPADNGSHVLVDKGMSGAMGGAIGYAKMKKELARVREGVRNCVAGLRSGFADSRLALRHFLSNCHAKNGINSVLRNASFAEPKATIIHAL